MHLSPILAVGIVGFACVIAASLWRENRPDAKLRAQPRPFTTEPEREMFGRLTTAFPDLVVMVKVSLVALLSVPLSERDKLRHRHIDFVLCDRELRVRAAVQLEEDEELQAFRVGESAKVLLASAGYEVFAWREMPTVEQLRAEMGPVLRLKPRALRDDAYAPKPSAD